jgi:heme oxygenase
MNPVAINEGKAESGGLAARLRAGTAQAHHQAEGGAFIQALFQGVIDRSEYGEFLRALRAVYGALEAGLLTHAGDPRVGPLARPEVFRVSALDRDLASLAVPPGDRLEATRRYVDRLEWATAHDPVLLIAHAYTRTLGDLSGGQMLKKHVQRAFGLTGDEGCAFFVFEQIEGLGAYKTEYRAALDALPLTEAERERVVNEAVASFEFNAAITRSLSR